VNKTALVLAATLVATGCPPEEEVFDVPDGGAGGPVARDAGLFPPNDAGGDAGFDAGPDSPCPDDDGFEDNDERASATDIAGEVNAVACGGDDDWYGVTTREGCLLSARLRFDPSSGDIDLHLFGPGGELIDAQTGPADEKTVAALAPEAGDFAVRVRGDPGVATSYRVRFSSVCESDLMCPADDPFEDDDDLATATDLAEGETALGIVCGDDDDHYRLDAPAGCAVRGTLSYVHGTGQDLDLRFLHPDGSEGDRSLGTTGSEEVIELVGPAGAPTLRVLGFGGSFTENTYRAQLESICPSDLDCVEGDPYEPNDLSDDAYRLWVPSGALGQLCSGEEDWFRFTQTAGCTYTALLDFDHESGNLELRVEDSASTLIGQGVTTDDDEEVTWTAAAGGTVRARVFALSTGVENTYGLSVSESCPPAP
jgi:hypothetical protein